MPGVAMIASTFSIPAAVSISAITSVRSFAAFIALMWSPPR